MCNAGAGAVGVARGGDAADGGDDDQHDAHRDDDNAASR